MPDIDREQQRFLEAEHLVELRSVELKKELRVIYATRKIRGTI